MVMAFRDKRVNIIDSKHHLKPAAINLAYRIKRKQWHLGIGIWRLYMALLLSA